MAKINLEKILPKKNIHLFWVDVFEIYHPNRFIPHLIKKGAKMIAKVFITLIKAFRAGPAVSLKGSPTVSPTTAAL